MYKYHRWSKDDKFLRKAIYEVYGQRCALCGIPITAYTNIEIDHIYPSKAPISADAALNLFLDELRTDGFDTDHPNYIENYRLLCRKCNREKSNTMLEASSYRELFQKTKEKTPEILDLIDKYKKHIPTDIDAFKPENTFVDCLTAMPPLVTDKDIIHRGHDVAEILEMLEDEKPAVLLSGFGGIGKTALAQLLFHKIKGEFDEVAWIPYHGSLRKSVIAVIHGLESFKTEEEKWSAITALKNDGKKKLVVIDNADHDEINEQNPAKDTYLSAITGWGNTTVIVTSRLDHLRGYQSYPVGFLSPENCFALFFHYSEHSCTPDNEEAAKELIELAKCHTFTVELLAKGGDCESSLREYGNALKEKGFSFPEIEIDADKDEATATIAEHLKMLFDLQTRTADQTKFLQCLATLPEGAPLSKGEISKWFGFSINVYDPLVKAGWISRNEGMYAMHPLVKEIILLDELPEDTANQFLSFTKDCRNNYFPSGEVYTATMRKLEIIDSVLTTLQNAVNKDTTNFADIYHNAASAYMQLADYDTALVYNQKALEIYKVAVDADYPAIASTYNNIAGVYYHKGDFDNALIFYQEALHISEAKLGTGHLYTATTYNNIAGVFQAKGDYDKALSFNQKALRIREAKLGTDHPDTATTYNNIALVYQAKSDYDKALRFFQKALRISEAKLGPDHPDTAATYNNIALVYQANGNYDMAISFYQKALEICEAKLGTDHPDTAATYNNIAGVYQDKGDYDMALSFYQKALRIREANLSTDHPSTAKTYLNIGVLQYQMKSYQDGLENLLKAYLVFSSRLGVEHPYTKIAFRRLPYCYIAAYPDGEPFEDWLQKQLDANTEE